MKFYGYDLDEIDELAAEVFHTLAEEMIPTTLAVLVLCRTITMLGTEQELDIACTIIDQLREMVAEESEVVQEDDDERH